MLLTKESRTLHEARTGSPYVVAVRKDTTPVPTRFYCHWMLPGDTKQYDPITHKELKNDKEGRCCFNHRVGLPTRKWETDIGTVDTIPVELTHFNYRMMLNYFKHRKYSQNKTRGSGASEILTIRYMIFKYGVLTREQNRKCIILPGTSSKLSAELSTRLKAICDRIPKIYRRIPTSDKPVEFIFKTGGRIILTSATPDASRGFENVGDIHLEEVAHWELIDDMPVYYATEGVHEKTLCHLVHSTTPRGKRGFYYDLVWNPDATSDFYKHVTNWREIIGLPVQTIEELYPLGHISDEMLVKLRKECLQRYKKDASYHEWYNLFFVDHTGFIPIEELLDVPIAILDINAIVDDSKTDRSHYDQELDNKFISGENRAIGEFVEADFNPDDLAQQIAKFNETGEFNPDDYE